MSPELRRQVLELYREVDQAVADAGPVCLASGRCCHFKEFDHVLFLSNLEAEILLEEKPAHVRAADECCPYQHHNLCTARERRPLACRIYYCDPAYQGTAGQITEHYLGKIKALVSEQGLEWHYAPLITFVERNLPR
jgi:hypothetical protein